MKNVYWALCVLTISLAVNSASAHSRGEVSQSEQNRQACTIDDYKKIGAGLVVVLQKTGNSLNEKNNHPDVVREFYDHAASALALLATNPSASCLHSFEEVAGGIDSYILVGKTAAMEVRFLRDNHSGEVLPFDINLPGQVWPLNKKLLKQ